MNIPAPSGSMNRSGVLALALAMPLLLIAPATKAQEISPWAAVTAVAGAYPVVSESPALVWLNPSLLGWQERHGAADISYRRPFELEELEELALSVRHCLTPSVAIGTGLLRSGKQGLYQETRLAFAASCTLQRDWTIGAGWEIQRSEYGDGDQRFTGSAMSLATTIRPVRNTIVTGVVRGLVLERVYSDVESDPIVELAAAWSAPPDITVGGIWSHVDRRDRFGVGQRLRLGSGLEFLSGLSLDPVRYSLGGRIMYAGGSFEYAYQSHSDLGGTHVLGFGWSW
jgi:hypothetical protein